jgi:hypothetical protein
MTDEERQAITARVEAATPGPWTAGEDVETAGEIYAGDDRVPVLHGPPFEGPRTEDMSFIAHARTDVPALLAEVERLRAELHAHEVAHDRRIAEAVKRGR